MILFSPAKINIGLQIIQRRGDGFHNLQSIMIPVGLFDILEIRRGKHKNGTIRFNQSGIQLGSPDEINLCVSAWELFSSEAALPPVELHLHKQIPVGAGLGGGSSNATHTLIGLNQLAGLPLSDGKLKEMSAQLGSDCPFFFHNVPMMMEGRGEILNRISLPLDQSFLVLLFPGIHVSTADAYSGVKPVQPEVHLRDLISKPMDKWKGNVVNAFEYSVFKKYPDLDQLKHDLYDAGAIYASLSGSGSSLYGFFSQIPELPEKLERHVVWKGRTNNPAQST